MPNETTPKLITDTINKFCRTIQLSSNPFFVPVDLSKRMLPNECFHNVTSVVDELGGKVINGWVIWQWANIMVEAEAHAIWETPDGRLLDITPHINKEERILFLPDDTVHYTGYPIPNRRYALTCSPLVTELITLFDQRDEIAAASQGKTYAIPKNMYKRMIELERIFHRKVGRNDPCCCGSGLKYKKCCGQYE